MTETVEEIARNGTPARTETVDETAAIKDRTSSQLEQMRPALVIVLGGTGQLFGVHLKAALIQRYGQDWRDRVRIVAFDTTDEPYVIQGSAGPVRLEPGDEYHHIGNVPVPAILRNIDNLPTIQSRLGSALHRLPATALRNGAKSIPALGLIALLWHFSLVREQLKRALWELAGREQQGASVALQQQGINVFICSSLVGGTGRGMLIDVAYQVRDLFSELGTQADFCHITGLGFLPQAFPGIPATNLNANAGSSLQEIDHLMVHGNFRARYPDGRTVQHREAPFDLFYVLDGVDERGRTWPGIHALAAMAASGVYLQMASQVGRKGDNVFDNMDDALMGRTADGQGTFLASFGLAYQEFDAPAVAELCSRWLLQELIRDEWLSEVAGKPPAAAEALLQPVSAAQMEVALWRDPDGGQLHLDLRQPGWLRQKAHEEITAAARNYVQEYGHSRVSERLLVQLERNATALSKAQQAAWRQWVNDRLLSPGESAHGLIQILKSSQSQLNEWLDGSHPALLELDAARERQTVALAQAEAVLARATSSLPLGRNGRIRDGLAGYFQAATELYETQLAAGYLRAQRQVWSEIGQYLGELLRETQRLAEHLQTIAGRLARETAAQLAALQTGAVSHLSLADEAYVQTLYQKYRPRQVNVHAHLEKAPLDLGQYSSAELAELLLGVLRTPFAAVQALTIEDVIADRAAEMSVRARREQLFQMATPSWNLDRARLPQGGSDMKRVEVLGVPDVTTTLFRHEPTHVSTHDPHRLVAFVVSAGAPPAALQQYERYRQMMDMVRAQRPIFVLPQFMADANQSRLAFALGSIFGYIYNQGTYFYYQPSDELQSPLRLGNGLANAIAALEARDGLVRELMERIDAQIARLGLQQAIAILSEYYSVVPEGRTPLDDLARELKQLVREYSEELRQISEFSSGLKM